MVSLSMACRQASRPFRILALPLSKPRTLTPSSAPSPTTNNNTTTTATPATSQDAPKKTPLMLFQVIQPDPPTDAPPNLTKKVLDKASDFWLALGKKDPNTILYKCYKQGEKLMDRIEYEEWSLKSISEGQDVKIVEKGKESEQKHIEIPLLRPTLQDQPLPPLVPKLHRFLLHRIPFHRKMMWRSILVSPVTWPLAIIPVIPNFALFYVLWRAWSHYKAWRGALYLEELLKRGMIVERPSKELDQVYASKAPASITGSENSAPDETSSTDTSNKASPGAYEVDEKVVRDGEKLVPQAKGEEGAVDGTATPKSMVYHGESSASSTSSSSVKSGSGERTSEKIEKETLEVKNGAKEEEQIKPAASHPSLLLRPYHVPMLSKLFDLRPLEIIDVERAVEQAGLRAQKADEGKK